MEKLLILTYYWPPSGGPGVQRWLKFVKYLPDCGLEPVVVTVDPLQATYPLADDSLEAYVPKGVKVYHTSTREPYAIYKRVFRKEQVPYSGFVNESNEGFLSKLSRFIRGNLFVPDARKGWNSFLIHKATQLIREHDIKYFVTTSPPHSTQLAGLKLKSIFPHLTWIADLRDPWTDIFYYNKMLHLPFAKKKDEVLEKKVLKTADLVLTVSDFIARIFGEKLEEEDRKKINVIYNGYDEDDFDGKEADLDHTCYTIGYVGTLADDYNLNGFIKAVSHCCTLEGKRLRLKFTGKVSTKWQLQLEKHLGPVVSFQGHKSHSEAIKDMSEADMLLLVIPDISQNQGIITGKLFEYMATGRPVIGVGPLEGDAARILVKSQAGKMFDYGDTKEMGQFIQAFRNSQIAWSPDIRAINNFSRRYQTQRLSNLIKGD